MSEEDNNSFEGDTRSCSCCAACGIAEIDDIKVVPCDDCDLVKYCSDECQRDHKSEHEEECKKRAAELQDEILFKQPESSCYGDCPICSLPLPLDMKKSAMMGCCSKIICSGCAHANMKREVERRLAPSCPFCRTPLPETEEEIDNRIMKRIEANDPDAMCHLGGKRHNKGDYTRAFEYYTKATELGSVEAHYTLAVMYREWHGVEKDEGKFTRHLEEAAIGGHPDARYNLGILERKNGKVERGVKHFIIAATQGHDVAIKELMKAFKEGFVSKDVLASALRAQKAALDATKSPQRQAAEEFFSR